ncbi:MAG: Ig-like domain-containing protein, partial [Candidatus Paceibacterota bacterium]
QKCDTTQISPLTQEQKDNNQTAITPAKPIANSAGNQSNQNSNNTSGTTTTPEVGTTTVDQNQNATTEQPAPGLDQRCKDEGLNSENDCMIYLKQMNIVSECLSVGIKTKDDCRGLLNKYGSVLKCRNLNDQQCNKFINDVLLADLIGMSTETRQDLTAVAGEQAVINPQSSIITIPGNANNPPNEISVPDLPLAPSGNSVNVTLLPSAVSVDSTASQQTLSPVVIVFDTDGDGLQDDFEKRLGTDPNKKDTDGDGVDDGTEVRNNTDPLKPNQAATTPLDGVDKALARGLPLEQPKYSTAPVNETMSAQVSNVSPDSNEIRFTGRAEPNQVVTLFIYSAMPIVVTVKADNDGNWVYDLDKTLINGKHEIYVAVNNDKGLIDEFSLPTIFGVAEAKAITIDEFIKIGDSAATQVPEKSNNMMIFYVLGGLGFIILLVGAFLYIREKATH